MSDTSNNHESGQLQVGSHLRLLHIPDKSHGASLLDRYSSLITGITVVSVEFQNGFGLMNLHTACGKIILIEPIIDDDGVFHGLCVCHSNSSNP